MADREIITGRKIIVVTVNLNSGPNIMCIHLIINNNTVDIRLEMIWKCMRKTKRGASEELQ